MICIAILATLGLIVVICGVQVLVWIWPFVLIGLGVSGLVKWFSK